ncbi:hypothetical protein CMI42_02745 [Candidatus Pacearchaeota archaeon]|nr:hypothetical protein [Candidatus Pacearchaeota archaeon]
MMQERIKGIKNWKIPESEKEHIKDFVNSWRTGKITGEIVADRTIENMLDRTKKHFEYLNKSFDRGIISPKKPKEEDYNKKEYNKKLVQYKKDVKEFERLSKTYISDISLQSYIDSLISGKIKKKITKWVNIGKKKNGKPLQELKEVEIGEYSHRSYKHIISLIKEYIKFRLKEYPIEKAVLLDILSIKIKNKLEDPKEISPEHFDILLQKANAEKSAYLVGNRAVGTRAGEWHTLQMQCIKLPDLSKDRKWLELDIIESKTKKRITKVYDPDDQRILIDYYNERLRQGAKPSDLFFPLTHNAMRQWLRRISLKEFGIGYHPHQLRASAVNRNAESGLINDSVEMEKFYGWSHATGTSRRYLNSSKISIKSIDKKAEKMQGFDYKKQLKEIKHEKDLEIEMLKKEMKKEIGKVKPAIDFYEKIGKPLANLKDTDPEMIAKALMKNI